MIHGSHEAFEGWATSVGDGEVVVVGLKVTVGLTVTTTTGVAPGGGSTGGRVGSGVKGVIWGFEPTGGVEGVIGVMVGVIFKVGAGVKLGTGVTIVWTGVGNGGVWLTVKDLAADFPVNPFENVRKIKPKLAAQIK
jgi:hypothetical protein